jgi:hypothetical protein
MTEKNRAKIDAGVDPITISAFFGHQAHQSLIVDVQFQVFCTA